MRAKDFLKENINVDDYQKVWSMIQQNCQPFINEIGGINVLFATPVFRGSKDAAHNRSVRTIKCPVNRMPRDTPIRLHYAADKWFASKSGVSFRSNALFGTSNDSMAEGFGQGEYYEVLIPIGQFHYSWSPNIRDLTDALDRTPVNDDEGKDEFVYRVLDNADYYFDANLTKAVHTGNEIMINCKTAYLINPPFFFKMYRLLQNGQIR